MREKSREGKRRAMICREFGGPVGKYFGASIEINFSFFYYYLILLFWYEKIIKIKLWEVKRNWLSLMAS